MSKPLNQNASKPPDQRVWGKGRITADLGNDLKARLLSYSRHEKRTMKEIIVRAVESEMATSEVTCGNCGGTGKDGFDRCYPPNPYRCEACHGVGAIRIP